MYVLGQMVEARLLGQLPRAFQLVCVGVYTDDAGSTKASDLAERTADAAPEVGHDHSGS